MIQTIDIRSPLDHVGIAVSSLEEACRLYEPLLGETSSPPEVLETQGVRIAFVGAVELLEPLGPETTIGRFIERRGPGLHHIAYRTDDIEAELARLEAQGCELIDRVPRPGAHGHRVAFLHPSSTLGVLIELVQRVPTS
jgi:methylmalonyl-CoA/ethylmalonyl-CoA epimerase